jgi:hypothetical protein
VSEQHCSAGGNNQPLIFTELPLEVLSAAAYASKG